MPKPKSKPKPRRKPAVREVSGIRDRVIEQRKVSAAELAANPRNFKKHPERQARALRALLEEVGFAGSALAYYSTRDGGALTLASWTYADRRTRQDASDVNMHCFTILRAAVQSLEVLEIKKLNTKPRRHKERQTGR